MSVNPRGGRPRAGYPRSGRSRGGHPRNGDPPGEHFRGDRRPHFSRGRGRSSNHVGEPGSEFSSQFQQSNSNGNSENQNNRNMENSRKNCANAAEPIREYRFGFKELLELSSQDGATILTKFNTQSTKFNNTIKNEMKPDTIVLFMTCLSKMCNAHFDHSKATMIIKICQSNFISTLEQYFLSLPFLKINNKQFNKFFWDDLDDFWKNTFHFYKHIMISIPNIATEILPRLFHVNQMTVEGLRIHHSERLDPELQKQFDELQIHLTIVKDEMNKKLEKRKAPDENVDVPNDFTKIPIFPSIDELTSRKDVFVRPNIVDGAYENVEHYLDVQFRLMREDLISSMRDSIMSYKKDPKQKKYEGGRFYHQVEFKHFAVINKSVGILLAFNKNKIVKNRRAFCKRFMYGSLLCFSGDNFNSCFFATVVDRSENLLFRGMILVKLENTYDGLKVFDGTYTMFESDVFFLQYGPVLTALQKLSNNFPMKKYVVDIENSLNTPYENLIIKAEIDSRKSKFLVDLVNGKWDVTSKMLGLDEYQYQAFKMALSREFVAIQGPPGTGKTFIGLKIVETLLENQVSLPILVLCFTNHALDQFLSGILQRTRKIVRIGGQSKDEKFASEFNLQTYRRKRHIRNPFFHEMSPILMSLYNIQTMLFYLDDQNGIIDLSIFNEYAPELNIKEYLFEFEYSKNRTSLINWLLIGDKPHELRKHANSNIIFENFELISTKKPEENDIDISLMNYGDIKSHLFIDDDDFDVEHDIKKFSENFTLQIAADLIQKLPKEHNKYQRYLLCELYYFKNQLDKNFEPLNLSSNSARALKSDERWMLYKFWCEELKKNLLLKTMRLQEKYQGLFQANEDFKMMCDVEILKNADIVGVTTTAAARLRSLLLSFSPSIVIVEEAAEVLESHIIVNLNENCKQVILIGDHQQLRPKTASYHLGKNYNLEISLFERLYKNKINCCQLGVQHRMRPEIANLIHPSIYPLLKNDPCVYEYPDVKGIQKNLFFIDHDIPETKDEIISSYSNEHEANYIIRLARYLIQQGYAESDITILCTYLGQMFTLRQIKQSYDILKDVKLCVLDNYQGEENKIILLTLVRSNSDNNTGFLKIANRICVALSRAKHGLYIIGNMTNLMHSSELWKTINNTLVQQNSIGSSIPLQCQNHGVITKIQTIDDFVMVAEGGCQSQCNVLLKCGHICQRLCHFDANNHENITCKMNCERECILGHKCKLFCFQKCRCDELVPKILECGHENIVRCHIEPKDAKCLEKITYKLPQCSHEKIIYCGEEKKYVKCEKPCGERLPCGHACINFCHKDKDPEHLLYECKESCSRKYKNCVNDHHCEKFCFQECDLCFIKVLKKRSSCSHAQKVSCHEDINLIPCTKKCTRSMACGHFCQKKCCEPCTGCSVQVKKIRSCGHQIFVECSKDVESVKCTERCLRNMKCGHRCWNKCNETCGVKPCREMVSNPYKSLCGHDYQIMCQDSNLGKLGSFLTMKYCKNPCGVILRSCEHLCQGKCGECKGRLHAPCAEKCENPLICGHICNDPCREYCSVCRNPCDTACSHSKCSLICGLPCRPCVHECKEKCPHGECTKKCGEICDRMPCSEPCLKKLKCNHVCYGLCGEQCPDICKICRPEEIEIFFGDEDEEDARFLKLIDCGHVIEVNGMDEWVKKSRDNSEIGYPRCPSCNKLIKKTPRYFRDIKQAFDDVQKVKEKNYGDFEIIKKTFEDFHDKMIKLDTNAVSSLFVKVSVWKNLISKIKGDPLVSSCLKVISNKPLWEKKVIQLSQVDVDNLNIQIDILTTFVNIFIKNKKPIETLPMIDQTEFILQSMLACKRKFTQQRAENFYDETNRTEMMLKLEISKPYVSVDIREKLEKMLFSNSPYASQKKFVEDLLRHVPVYNFISAEERKMIVKAVGLRQGHWFKCPNGHPYCIGECGGAMQISKCPECGCPVGGSNHALLAGNSLAPEMDQAQYAAFSDIANEQIDIRINPDFF